MASKFDRLDLDGDLGLARPGTTKFITIPRTAVGKLIGKGGSTIKSLQSKSGAKIRIDNCQVTINGEVAQVKMAERLIKDLVGDLRLKTIKIGKTQIPLLIGAKGSRIKSIQDESGVRMKINQETPGGNADVCVDITGTTDQIAIAEQLIANAIVKAPPVTEMSMSGSDTKPKLVLKQLDKGVKEQDLLDMYPDTHIRPNIVIRAAKGEAANFATLTFASKADMKIWMNQFCGKMLLGRRIISKKN